MTDIGDITFDEGGLVDDESIKETFRRLFGDEPDVKLGIPRIEIILPAATLLQLRHVPSREPEKDEDE